MQLLFNRYGTFDCRHVIGPAHWAHFDLLVIHQGQIKININDQTEYFLGKHEALLLYPDTPFSGVCISDIAVASAHHFVLDDITYPSPLAHLNTLSEHSTTAEKYSFSDNLSVIADLERLLTLSEFYPEPDMANAFGGHLMSLVLLQLLGKQTTVSAPVNRHHSIIENLISEFSRDLSQPIRIDDMASQALMSPSHFRKIFGEVKQRPPGTFFKQMKLDEVCRLLVETNLPIKTIAARLGYGETSQMYRLFKQYTRQTPADYREKYRFIG